MTTDKIGIFITRRLPEVVETRMRELFDARLNVDDKPMSKADLIEAVKTADVLVPTVTDKIDKSVLSQAGSQLKLIANFGFLSIFQAVVKKKNISIVFIKYWAQSPIRCLTSMWYWK